MKTKLPLLSLLLLLALGAGAQIQENIVDSNNLKKPKMQVVFALDATGSMSGLIHAAKDKIWSIVSSLTQTQTTPDIEVGLVFYRDRGDAFITKRVQLTDSMDMVYNELMKIRAEGGGDGPESVNQGLNEAVELFKWDQDTSTYKAIFLVGDFEPHMNYKNDVPYYESCKIAKSRDIVLNTILMGSNKNAERVWREIAACNEGAYVNVDMNVNDITVETPYDSAIALISDKLDDMRYYYGSTAAKTYANTYKIKSKQTALVSKVNVKAQRAEYNSYYNLKKSSVKQNELLGDIASKNVRLDSLKQEELPDEFKNLSKDSLAIVIKQKTLLRDSLQKELNAVIAKRNSYVEAELSKRNKTEVENSFNGIIFSKIQQQTQKKKIVLKGKAKY
ncbi:vWA domain-containing protein [Ferruginibacter sp.]